MQSTAFERFAAVKTVTLLQGGLDERSVDRGYWDISGHSRDVECRMSRVFRVESF